MAGFARVALRGVTYYDPKKAYNGYTLIAPQGRFDVWLIDMEGRFVHRWKMPYQPGPFARLLPNGNLRFSGALKMSEGGFNVMFLLGGIQKHQPVAGQGGVLMEVDWEGNLVWKYQDPYLSHDFYPMENGNTMAMRSEQVPDELRDRVKGGFYGADRTMTMWDDSLNEITPDGKVVWEWKGYEHLDPEIDVICPMEKRGEWTHMNTCTVLPDGNILTCFRQTNAIAIIDKKTGDIIWRFGSGVLGHPHEPTWLENGNILLFDNGCHRGGLYPYSKIVELDPKTEKIVWQYQADPPTEFYSGVLSGCQRLPNGNTLICESNWGRIFEVTPDGETVWEYVNPLYGPKHVFRVSYHIFRAYRFGPDYPGLKEKELDPNKYLWINKAYGPQASGGGAITLSKEPKLNYARTKLTGLTLDRTWQTYHGFTLYTPLTAKRVLLIDMQGRTVHQWEMPCTPALYGELLPSGNLLYAGHVEEGPLADFEGAGGALLEVDWDGNTIWKYEDSYLHHAFARLPNGNTMVLKWVKVPEKIAAKVKGGIAGTEREGVMWGDCLQEISPTGKVVWEWLAHEHLDPEKDDICPLCYRSQWSEANSLFVLPNDDILVCFQRIDKLYIISKDTGDIIWRWGGIGELSHPNHATMLENGNVMVFDNGVDTVGFERGFSRVLEIDRENNEMAGVYLDEPATNFFAAYMSSVQRLPNGNTLICEAPTGRIYEVKDNVEVVWEFVNPLRAPHPYYGNTNAVPRAYRYGPDYPGLKQR